MKPTFKKRCKYCSVIMDVETDAKTTCYICKVKQRRKTAIKYLKNK